MAKKVGYTLIYASNASDQFASIDRKFHRLIEKVILEQLTYTPLAETRNRKMLEQPAPFGAAWELRCGPGNRFRVFYRVDEEQKAVRILAIGVKNRDRLLFGDEEYEP